MAFADILEAIRVHAVAAGAAVSPVIDDVLVTSAAPTGRSVRIYYLGEEDPVVMPASVLDTEYVADVIRVTASWPLSALSETDAAAVEVELYTFKHTLRSRIDQDRKLGGQVANVFMRNCEPQFALTAGGEVRFVDIDIVPESTAYPLA